MAAETPDSSRRVLLLAPTARDGETTRGLLASASIDCFVCHTLGHVCAEAVVGAAAVIVPEEVVLSDEADVLAEQLRQQPVWSDIPVIVLSRSGAESHAVEKALATLGNVTLIERPMRISTLLSAVSAALRARERQYQVRDHLDARRMVEFRFQRLVEHSPLSTQLFHPDGRTRQVNRAFKRLFGITPDQLRDYSILRDPELVRHGVMPLMERAFSGEAVTIAPIPYVPDRGEYAEQTRWVGAYVYPVKDEAGRVEEVVLVHNDVTEQRVAEEALRESEERLRAVFQQTEAGIAQVDLGGRFVLANNRYAQIIGRSREELLNLRMQDITHPDDLPRNLALLEQAVRDGTPFVIEKRYVRPDGSHVWVSNSVSVTRDADGKPNGVVAASVDITDRRRAEAERERAKEQAEQSLAQWRAVVESMTEGLVLADAEGNLLLMNPAALAIHEFASVEEMLKRLGDYPGLFELHDAEGRFLPLADWPISRVLRGERFSGYEVEVQRRDTGRRWIGSYGGTPVRDADGRLQQAVLTLRDVTDQRRAQAALRSSEELVRTIAENSTQGLAMMDARGYCTYANKAWLDMTGCSVEEIGSKPLHYLVHHHYPDGRPYPIEDCPIDRALPENFDVRAHEDLFFRKDGSTFPVLVAASPIFKDGRPISTVIEIRDVTEAKRAESERERLLDSERGARAEAERASRMKDEFLATLSHELRTPLNAILGWSQILAGGAKDAEDLSEGLRTIERNARAQTQIIEDLLDMSRIISGKVRLDVQRIDLAPVVHGAVESIKPAAEAKGISLQAVLDPLAGPVSGDPNRLQQVMWNLLTNAVKFTPRGGRVQVVVERVNSHLEISVSDTGEGIEPEFLPHVFDRFRQADASTTRRHGGLGLGLAIVKQLVELHGGSIRASSSGPGTGATFTVSLPMTVVHPEPADEPSRRHPVANVSGVINTATCLSLAGVRVLVVDDEPDALNLVRRLLENCEAVVTTAGSASEAMKLVQAEPPDVVVSDIGMPNEDGYAFIRKVRALGPQRGGDVPAVALTAYARSEDRMRSVLAGFHMHVAKPVEPAELITMVASLAGRTR
ncbi:MAG TPA: PAS domain S-box protein [Tepidisphaeraceae bacterium]|nr:PAS domain S-box protein [Tepidisphaeraceae bacterium]